VGFDIVVVGGVLHVSGAGIDKVACDVVGIAMLLELDAKVRGVGEVFFFLTQVGRHKSVGDGVLDGTVLHGCHRDAGSERRRDHASGDGTVASIGYDDGKQYLFEHDRNP
jgi:hypothetical protein